MQKRRRDFLKAAAAASASLPVLDLLASCPAALAEVPGSQPGEAGNKDITLRTFAEAEKLTGVPNTEAERAQLLRTIDGQIGRARQLRELGMDNGGPAPALVFDPRLPGSKMPKAAWRREARVELPAVPAAEADIAFAPITVLSEWLRHGQLTSRQLTDIYLRRIERYNRELECMVTVTADLAIQQAEQADAEIAAGRWRGPLHGIPYGAKDLLDTRNIPTTWGAMAYKDRIAQQDAAVIERLNEAGAVLLGKTTLGTLASFSALWFGGLTRNPWNTEEGAGGSSAGSASAVAAGLMPFALGTETLGSIEFPASRNGVVGLRPTFGRVSRHGSMVLCWSLDKVGPLCRSAEDAMLVLRAINGYDARDVGSIEAPLAFDNAQPVKGMRVGYVPAWFEREGTPAAIVKTLNTARDLGLELVEIELPDMPYRGLVSILDVEAAAAFEALTLSGRDDTLRAQTLQAWPNRFRQARFVSAVDIIQADRLRRSVMGVLHDLFADLDAIIGPGLLGPGRATIMSLITNFTGHPSLTLRAGFNETAARRQGFADEKFYGGPASGIKRKVPVSVALWGPLFEEGRICRIGMALERALDVQALRPPLAT